MKTPADWQLPAGVSRGLWDYLHDPAIARDYDAGLADTSLARVDVAFAEQHFHQPGRLIDLGCGTGRLLIPFAQRGCWVLGVDLSEEMLQVTTTKADAAGVTVHCLRANIVELGFLADARFDYAACLFSTLGMVAGGDNRRRVVQEAYRLLRPGGKLIVHVHNRWFNFWNPVGRRWLGADVWRWLRGRPDAGDAVLPPHRGIAGLRLHLFSCSAIARLLREVGFHLLEIRPVSLAADGRLAHPWWFGRLRAYGYLLAAQRP